MASKPERLIYQLITIIAGLIWAVAYGLCWLWNYLKLQGDNR